MIDSGNIAQRTKAITDELRALKSSQALSSNGANLPAVVGDYSGSDTNRYPDMREITFGLRVTYTPSEDIDFVPLAQCAYREYEQYIYHPSDPVTSYWAEPIIESISGNRISWLIYSAYDVDYSWIEAGTVGRNIELDINIFSMVRGTITTARVI